MIIRSNIKSLEPVVKSFSSKNMDTYISNIIIAAKQIIFWSLPAIAIIVVLRAQIIRVILGSDTFSWSDTRLTAASVALFVISLVTQGLVLLFVRGYYAASKTKKPLIVNVFSSIMVVVFAYIIIYIFLLFVQFFKKKFVI